MVEIFVERRPEGLGEPTEEAAFAELYNRTYNPLVAYCRRYCPPGYDAEDIAQEALSRAWSSWDRYSPSRPFWPWVATIARRLCVDYWRRDERAIARAGGAAALIEPVAQPRPDELSEAADECRMAVTAFRGLRPDHQRIVGLRDIEGWSYEDIARFEGVTVESVRGSLRRARLSLRKSYETLSKTAVPVLIPGALLRRFELARTRLAARMARWNASLADAGVASTRFGEALVSLMALSVAVVGLGAPGSVAVAAADGSGSTAGLTAASAAGSGSGPTTTVPAAVAETAADAGSTAQNVAPAWSQPDFSAESTNPAVPRDIKDSSIYHFTVSPHYGTDHTVFAVGIGTDLCGGCQRLFRSTNGGTQWDALPAVGLTGDRLLLPPAYPRDGRIFATGTHALEVSVDGGLTFIPLTPSLGTAVMSPRFSDGDPRILLSDAPGRQYDDRLRAIRPLELKPDETLVSQRFSFAFPTAYDPANPVMYIGASQPSVGVTRPATVTRCVGTVCGDPVALPGTGEAPTAMFVVPGDHGDVILAHTGRTMFRSVDSGATFQPVANPAGVDMLADVTVGTNGVLSVLALNLASADYSLWRLSDGGQSWSSVPMGALPTKKDLATFATLPDGSLLVGMRSMFGGVACSVDGGKHWNPHC